MTQPSWIITHDHGVLLFSPRGTLIARSSRLDVDLLDESHVAQARRAARASDPPPDRGLPRSRSVYGASVLGLAALLAAGAVVGVALGLLVMRIHG